MQTHNFPLPLHSGILPISISFVCLVTGIVCSVQYIQNIFTMCCLSLVIACWCLVWCFQSSLTLLLVFWIRTLDFFVTPHTHLSIRISLIVACWPCCCPGFCPIVQHSGAKTIKKKANSTQNKSQTHRAKKYEVTSFLSTDCELSTETCSNNV